MELKLRSYSKGGRMKRTFVILVAVFSLSFGYFENADTPQLEFISNAFELLWDKPKTDVLAIMSIFPHFTCTDYGDQLSCLSGYNRNDANIFLNFFTDDYEERHDNLWKVSVTVDVSEPAHFQEIFQLLWLEGMKPFHSEDDEVFTYKGVQPLCFKNKKTTMTAYFQPFDADNNPFFLVEYYSGSVR